MRFDRRTLFLGAAAAAGAPPGPRAAAAATLPVGRRFTGEALRAVAFPLGGIGTGAVSLGGYGNLRYWTGVEFQVAAHLFMEGRSEAALRIVRAVRDRHDGRRRNPWDEVECGHHYARALSSWSLLAAISGARVNLAERRLKFLPRTTAARFRCLFTSGTAWG